MKEAQDLYGTYGGVPNATPQSTATPSMGVRASPAAFGAPVGAALEKAGNTTEDLAIKYQGIANETAMTQADADFATKVGAIKADYTSKTGMAAYNAFPQYQEDIKTAFSQARTGLPPAAQLGFDRMAARTMANHVADGSSYATSQLKEANRDTYSSLASAQLQSLLDPDIAKDKDRSQEHLDTAAYAAQAQMDVDHPGLKTDPKTGEVSFDEATPEGQKLKANFQQRLDAYLAQGYVNRYSTLAKLDVFGAHNEYMQERDQMPKAAQVALDASFAPKLQAAHTSIAANSTLGEAAQKHWDALTNPSRDAALDVVQKNEGGMSDDGQSAYGIDKIAHPAEFAKISSMPESDRSAYARKFFKEEYYDKKGIADLPANTQTIVMDGVVNHTAGFGDKLIQAAKDGATPQQLIDMRREEYQRVAQIPGKEQYLQGWNNRLDGLPAGTGKTYATNENGAPLSRADYYRLNSNEILARGDAYAEQQMPGDLALKRAVRQSLSNEMSRVISNEHAQQVMDNRNVMRGITGELTKGKAPQTEEELRAIPGMANLLDKVAYQDPKFAETIPALVAKVAKRDSVENSPNAYDTILRTLEPNNHDHPNKIGSQDQLDKLLGRTDGTGINAKDYKDAKQAIEVPSEVKEALLQNMKDIAVANGNVDGRGEERALQWYNQTMAAYKQNTTDKKMTDSEFVQSIGEKSGPPMPQSPSRMQQIANWAKKLTQPDNVRVVHPDGRTGMIPASQLDEALGLGYKRVE